VLAAAFVVVLLIAINALYVAAEFSAVSVRRSRIRQAAEDGNALARRLIPFISDPHRLDRYIAACQIGITISSLVLGAYGQATLAPALMPVLASLGGLQDVAAQSISALVILVGLTVLQMVIGELVPKSLALQFPTATAYYTVIPMQWSLRLLAGFIAVLNGSGLLILRLLGMKYTGHRHLHSPEEIEYLIAESREGGLLRPEEHERLNKALSLGVTRVEEIMMPRTRIAALHVDTSFSDAVRVARTSAYTRLPVHSGSLDEMLGYVHIQDIASRMTGESSTVTIRSLIRPLLVIPPRMTAERALTRMREERRHIALVVDEHGGTAGLLSVGDLLDQIFGGIADEFKPGAPSAERLPDGRIRLPGDMRLAEAAFYIGRLWEGDAITVGGAVMERAGRVPRAGAKLFIDGVAVEVERVESHHIDSILAVPADPLPDEDYDELE
jgi:putative hemolysin